MKNYTVRMAWQAVLILADLLVAYSLYVAVFHPERYELGERVRLFVLAVVCATFVVSSILDHIKTLANLYYDKRLEILIIKIKKVMEKNGRE